MKLSYHQFKVLAKQTNVSRPNMTFVCFEAPQACGNLM